MYNVWAKRVQRSYIWWHWRLMQNLKENWFVLSKITWKICQMFVHKLKNSDFIFESKMAELNQNKNSKQPDGLDAVWKLYFIYLWNKCIIQFTESLFLRYKKISEKAVKLGSFLQCSVHIFLRHDGCVWKINLRILWSHTMKNFQVKHGQCDSIILPQNICTWRL